MQYQPYPPPPPPYAPMPPPPPRKERKLSTWFLLVGVLTLALIVIGTVASATTRPDQATSQPIQQPTGRAPLASEPTPHGQSAPTPLPKPTATPTPLPTATPTPLPTATPTPQRAQYPPKTLSDLRALAARGDANALHGFRSESVGLEGVCPQPKRLVTVDLSITGQQLAQDMLAYFFTQGLDSPCGSVVFAYHAQSEVDDVYTASRISVKVTDAMGQVNIKPNASGLTHAMNLDVGGFFEHQEYTITY